MRSKVSKWWTYAFLAVPLLYFVTQLLPYFHSGGTVLPSLGSLYWFPEENGETIAFLNLFYSGFRINELTFALLGTQFFALFLLILTPLLKSKGTVALLLGVWGVFGIAAFFATRSLTFSSVMVYGGFAGILMLMLFLAAIALSAAFFYLVNKTYRKHVALIKAEEAELAYGEIQ